MSAVEKVAECGRPHPRPDMHTLSGDDAGLTIACRLPVGHTSRRHMFSTPSTWLIWADGFYDEEASR